MSNDPQWRAPNPDVARACYLARCGPQRTAARADLIASLPAVEWRGQILWIISCVGGAEGPHDWYVQESMLWSLRDLGRYRCPFHAAGVTR